MYGSRGSKESEEKKSSSNSSSFQEIICTIEAMKSGKSWWKKWPHETNSSSSLITAIPTAIDFLIISIRSFRVQKDLSWILERSGKKIRDRKMVEERTRDVVPRDRRPLKILLVLLVKHLSVAQTQSNVITSTRIFLLKQIFPFTLFLSRSERLEEESHPRPNYSIFIESNNRLPHFSNISLRFALKFVVHYLVC